MNFPASFVSVSQCSSSSVIRFQPLALPLVIGRQNYSSLGLSRIVFRSNGKVVCKMSETESEPDSDNNDTEIELGEEAFGNHSDQEENVETQLLESNKLEDQNGLGTNVQMGIERNRSNFPGEISFMLGMNFKSFFTLVCWPGFAQDDNNIQVASGSPLPGVKPQQLDESIRIPRETIDILKDQIFGFDTFFVTSQEPYEGGVLFKENLRGQAAKSYEKITKRMQDRLGDAYKLFLLINPEDDKPVAVVVPRKTLQPDTTAVPEWFAAGAFGLVTVFTLLLRNVPALQSNLLSSFDNLELLKEGLPGALVTALLLGVHEVSHILVANTSNIKLGLPYFVPSWQALLVP